MLEFYKKLRPGDPPTLDNARSFMQNLLFQLCRYDLARWVATTKSPLGAENGRAHLDQGRFGGGDQAHHRHQQRQKGRADDIDHLGNRRIKTVGELIQNQLRIGLLRMERVVRERMSIRYSDQVTPLSLINIGGGGDA